jgi:hypothetical protein
MINGIRINARGKSATKEYTAFARILDDKENMVYKRWVVENGFFNFLEDVGHAPDIDYALVKINKDGYYEPSNLMWKRKLNVAAVIEVAFISNYTHAELKQAGVYRLVFDNGYFYIGSSKSLKTRLQLWKQAFKIGRIHNKMMRKCVSDCKSISFEVLEYTMVDDCKPVENKYLAGFIGEKYLLNRSFDSHSNKGCKWTEDERLKMSEATKGKSKSPNRKKRGPNKKKSGPG